MRDAVIEPTTGGYKIDRRDAGTLKKLFGGFFIGEGIDPSPDLQYEICREMITLANHQTM